MCATGSPEPPGDGRIATTQAGGSADRRQGTQPCRVHENLIALWKDAGRDLPVLLQARREYARLQ